MCPCVCVCVYNPCQTLTVMNPLEKVSRAKSTRRFDNETLFFHINANFFPLPPSLCTTHKSTLPWHAFHEAWIIIIYFCVTVFFVTILWNVIFLINACMLQLKSSFSAAQYNVSLSRALIFSVSWCLRGEKNIVKFYYCKHKSRKEECCLSGWKLFLLFWSRLKIKWWL